MRLVDTNVLVNAVNTGAPSHHTAKHWLDSALSGAAPVGFAWLALIGFVRISTRAAILERPLTSGQALDVVEAWLGARSAAILQPGSQHARHLRALLKTNGAAGNLTNDAHLAAIALEHKATVVTFDSDFARFKGVRWERPR